MKNITPLLFVLLSLFLCNAFGQAPLVKLWDAEFGSYGYDELSSMEVANDGGFILGGYSFHGAGADKTDAGWGAEDYWVVKVNVENFKEWDRTIGGTSRDLLDFVKPTRDGGFLAGGGSVSPVSGNKTEPQISWPY